MSATLRPREEMSMDLHFKDTQPVNASGETL
jgi:hypothetical protein